MRAVVNYADGPVGWLDWQPDPFGVQVTVDCEIPSGAPPLLRCWGETGGEPLLVGLPAPEGLIKTDERGYGRTYLAFFGRTV